MATRTVDLRRTFGPRQVRLLSAVDDGSRLFEAELARVLTASPVEGAVRELPWVQTHAYLERTAREYRLLQVRDAAGTPSAQIAVFLARPRRAPRFASATAERFGPAATGEEEESALGILRELFAELGEVMTLRLRPERYDATGLWDFQERARRAGFSLVDALDVTRTLVCDLRPSEDALLAAFSAKTRMKLRSKDLESVEIRTLTDPRLIPGCRAALNAAFARSVGGTADFEFETAFSLAAAAPDRATLIGLFERGAPDRLLAYVTGFRSGAAAEYSSAGSLDDARLRTYPFNYWLLWNLLLWAKRSGASFLDLRGVTGGGTTDPLAGISDFKRRFPSRETEVGREMEAVLKPALHSTYRTLQKVRALGR